MKQFPCVAFHRRFIPWLLALFVLIPLVLGFPAVYFSVKDQSDFSNIDIQNAALNTQVYIPADNTQTVKMLLQGNFTPVYSNFSEQYALQQAQACLDRFSQGKAKTFARLIDTLFLDTWQDDVELLMFQQLAGLGVYDDTVLTANLCLAAISRPETSDLPATVMTFTFDQSTFTIYSLSFNNINCKKFDDIDLEQALLEYELIYLGLDPFGFDFSSEQEIMSVYSSEFGPFLPCIESDYRFLLYPISIYFDGEILSVNENM